MILLLFILLAFQTATVRVGQQSQAYIVPGIGIFDLPEEIWPGCWQGIKVAAVPANCRVIVWNDCDLGTDPNARRGYMACDLTVGQHP